jgi:hypothetical protein
MAPQNLVAEAAWLWNGTSFDRARGPQGAGYVSDGGSTCTAIAAVTGANTVIKAAAGRLCRILATTVGTADSVLVYDNATTTGTVIGALPANAGNAANPAVTVAFL